VLLQDLLHRTQQ